MNEYVHSRMFHIVRALARSCGVLAVLILAMCNVSWAAEDPKVDRAVGKSTLSKSDRDVPHWQDVGLEDVLAVGSQPSVPTARTVRPAFAPCEVLFQKLSPRAPKGTEKVDWVVSSRGVPGCFLYFLLSLRL